MSDGSVLSVVRYENASSGFDDLVAQPADVGNRSTQACPLTVEDVGHHLVHAQAVGARVEVDPRDDGDDGCFYRSRDPEGHLWSFGNPLAGAPLANPDRPFEGLRLSPAKSSHAALGRAMLFGLTIASSAALYLGAADAAAGQLEREGLITVATKRLAEAEAVGADMTEKRQLSQLQFAQALQQKQSADKLPSASEAEYQNRLKETQNALDTALRAKEVASQELEAERLRAQVIQQQLYDASEKLASQRADDNKGDADTQHLRAAMAQLSDALLGSKQAAEVARGQLAVARLTEKGLREQLRASARETAELRARVSELEAEQDAARARTAQDAEATRTALAAARTNAVKARDKLRASERGTANLPATVTAMETKKEAARLRAEKETARLRTEQDAEAERQRQTAATAAAARKVEEERQRLAAEADRQRQAAETAAVARKAEEERQRLAAEVAQKVEAERHRQTAAAAAAAAAARKAEEERQRLAVEAAQKAEVERQRQAAEAAAAARKAEEERQRLAAEVAQKAEAERQQLATAEAARIAKEAAEAKARADQETRRRALGLTVTPEDGARFLARGRALLTTGDVTSARLFLERASNAGLADAAMELAETYDPATVTKRLNVVGLVADREQARAWYMRAQALGSAVAAERLKGIGGQ